MIRRCSNALPTSPASEAGLLLAARGVRPVTDGLVSLVLPAYVVELGYGAWETGSIATARLVGSALLTLAIGLDGGTWSRRSLLSGAAVLMTVTGLGFVGLNDFWPLLLVTFVGTLNPSSGDVSVFLPLEQAELARLAPKKSRTRLFARYSFVGSIGAAAGALIAGVPDLISDITGLSRELGLKSAFTLYALRRPRGVHDLFIDRRRPNRFMNRRYAVITGAVPTRRGFGCAGTPFSSRRMIMMEIYWGSGSPFAWRVLLALEIKKIPYASRLIEFSKGQHKAPEFLALNPRGKVPTIRDGEFVLWESLAILAYLDRKVPEPPLFGRKPEDTGRVWKAVSEVVSYLEPPGYKVAGPIFFNKAEQSAAEIRAAIEPLHAELKLMEGTLSRSPWLAGRELSAADIVAYPLIETLLRAAGKDAARSFDLRLLPIGESYPATAAWRERIQAMPGYERTYPPHWRDAPVA